MRLLGRERQTGLDFCIISYVDSSMISIEAPVSTIILTGRLLSLSVTLRDFLPSDGGVSAKNYSSGLNKALPYLFLVLFCFSFSLVSKMSQKYLASLVLPDIKEVLFSECRW